MTAPFEAQPQKPDPSATDLVVAPIKLTQAGKLYRLRVQLIEEIPSAFGTPPEIERQRGSGYYRRLLQLQMLNGQGLLLGLWQDKELIGMTGAKPKWEQGKRIGLIYSMGVRADMRRRGGAGLLLERAEQTCSQRWGLEEVQLCVEIHNEPAKRFYTRKGYNELTHQRNAFQLKGQSHDILVMRKWLT